MCGYFGSRTFYFFGIATGVICSVVDYFVAKIKDIYLLTFSNLLFMSIGVFGVIFTYLISWKHNPITVNNVFEKALSIIIGILILALGISLAVIADVIMNSGEAFVKALADTTKKDFGKIKTYIDVGCVFVALILSLLLFDFKIVGIGIGTVMIALSTGTVARIYIRLLKKHIIQMITRSR